MRIRGREGDVELLNRKALEMARQVADQYGKLMAGNLSNNALYDSDIPETHEKVYEMMKVSNLYVMFTQHPLHVMPYLVFFFANPLVIYMYMYQKGRHAILLLSKRWTVYHHGNSITIYLSVKR